jgi:predicted Fe-Mo cluster-binding NifX family protein
MNPERNQPMRVAVPSTGDDLGSEVDVRFGRAPKFLIVDTETLSFESIENAQNLNLPQGAGIQSAQNVIQHKPDVVLTGNCGPKAFQVFQAARIQVVIGVSGRIQEAVQAYMNGEYPPASSANVGGHWGV